MAWQLKTCILVLLSSFAKKWLLSKSACGSLQSQTSTMNVVNCRWGTDWLLRNGGGFATYFFSCATPLSSPSPPLSPLSDSVASLVEEPVVVSFSSAKLSLFLVVRGREQSKRHAYFFRPFPLITQLKKEVNESWNPLDFAVPTFIRLQWYQRMFLDSKLSEASNKSEYCFFIKTYFYSSNNQGVEN